MRHNLEVSVSNTEGANTILCKKFSMRERFMRLLFGDMHRLWIVIPDRTVEAVKISEVPERGKHEAV